jgi:hypothetical protein
MRGMADSIVPIRFVGKGGLRDNSENSPAAWFNARQVVDLGRRAAKATPSTTPPSAKP